MAPTKEELAALVVRGGQEGGAPPLVVDVRDEDFELKGHVRGAVHLPQENFVADANVDALVDNFAREFSEIVFHCGHSNTCGPSCALRFMARLDAAQLPAGEKPRVRVLAGGFAAFAEVGIPELLEGAPEAAPPTK